MASLARYYEQIDRIISDLQNQSLDDTNTKNLKIIIDLMKIKIQIKEMLEPKKDKNKKK
jgi:hypothetical protein